MTLPLIQRLFPKYKSKLQNFEKNISCLFLRSYTGIETFRNFAIQKGGKKKEENYRVVRFPWEMEETYMFISKISSYDCDYIL